MGVHQYWQALSSAPTYKKTPGANRGSSRTVSRQDFRCPFVASAGSHRQPLAACLLVGDFVVSSNLSTTNPLDALLLPRVLRWVAVVFRQRTKCGHLDKDGRPWTRLPARDLAAQLDREEGLQVGVRRVQRSLERLVESGHLCRQQRTKWWGQRDYWYSWTDTEWALQQHRPTALARGAQGTASKVSSEGERKQHSEATVPSVQVLSAPLLTQHSLEGDPSRPTSSGNRASSAKGTGQPRRGRGLQALQGLQRVAQRAAARGFGGSKTPELAPQADTWVEGTWRFTRLPSGHVVKDDLATAPLR